MKMKLGVMALAISLGVFTAVGAGSLAVAKEKKACTCAGLKKKLHLCKDKSGADKSQPAEKKAGEKDKSGK